MSVGPMGGIIGSAAGAPLSQTTGSESERTLRETAGQQRQTDTDLKAQQAAGIGTTDEDQATGERDADGRRLWEEPPEAEQTEETGDEKRTTDEQLLPETRQSRDATGLSGNHLDLTG